MAPRALEGEQLALWLAAVVLDATDGDTGPRFAGPRPHPGRSARPRRGRRRRGRRAASPTRSLLRSFSHRLGIRPRDISQLAAHVGDVERLRSLDLLTRAGFELDTTEQQTVDEVVTLTEATLVSGEAGADDGGYAAHVAAAADLVPAGPVRERLESAPKSYALRVSVPDLARQAALCEPPPSERRPRVDVLAGRELGQWRIVVVARDRDRPARPRGQRPVPRRLRCHRRRHRHLGRRRRPLLVHGPHLGRAQRRPAARRAVGVVRRTAPDRAGRAARPHVRQRRARRGTPCARSRPRTASACSGTSAAAFASMDVSVHAAQVATVDGVAVNVFELTTSQRREAGRVGGRRCPRRPVRRRRGAPAAPRAGLGARGERPVLTLARATHIACGARHRARWNGG